MHVAIISPYSLSKPGGVQDHTRELAKALFRKGHDVTLFGPELRRPQESLDGIGTVSLGRAVNIPANGSIAPLGIDPTALVRLDLTSGITSVALRSAGEPFTLGGVVCDVRCSVCFVADAKRDGGVVHRFSIDDAGALSADRTIKVETSPGLPPRYLGLF